MKNSPEKGIDSGKGTGQEKSEATKGGKEALPVLELKELARSKYPINTEKMNQGPIESLTPWHNYTIVTLKESQEIRIFDNNAHQVEDFKPLSDKKFILYWRKIRETMGYQYKFIGRDSFINEPDRNYKVSGLPPIPRLFAKRELLNRNFFEIPNADIEFKASRCEIKSDGKYIVFSDENGYCFVFLTQNDAGVVLPPRNWIRIDPSYSKSDIPEDLEKIIETTLAKGGLDLKRLNSQYSALLNPVGISIIKNDSPKSSPVFSDALPQVESNLTIDPTNPNIIYYCQSSNPRNILRLDLSGGPDAWSPVSAELPKKYDNINNLQLDSSGNFFLFSSKEDLVVITKDTLEEVKILPGFSQVNFDEQGNIRAIDKDGHLVIYEPNFDELRKEMDKRRVQKLTEGIKITDIFKSGALKESKNPISSENFEYLLPIRKQYEEQFSEVLAKISTEKEVAEFRQGLNKLREALHSQGLKPNEIAFVIEELGVLVETKEKEFAVKNAKEAIAKVRASLSRGLSFASISEAKTALDSVKGAEALLDEELRKEAREVGQEFEQISLELFRQKSGEVIKDAQGLLSRTRTDLEGFTSKSQMDDWMEFRYPQLKSRLGSLARDIPLEADEAYKAIVAARRELQEIASSFEGKFKLEYAKVREKAVERTEATINTLMQDIGGLIDRLRSKGFPDRKLAEQYLSQSEAGKILEAEILALSADNPDAAKELDRTWKVQTSNLLTEIERGALSKVAETGQQMILFGKTYFPKWEAKVQEKGERKIELAFEEDLKTHGPGVKPSEIFGDVAININTGEGVSEKVRLYEGWNSENEWRLGLLSYKGEAIPSSYLKASEFKAVKKNYADWSQGEKSKIRKELEEKRDALKKLYGQREKMGKRTGEKKLKAFGFEKTPGGGQRNWEKFEESGDEIWKKSYKEALQKYGKFCAEHNITLLRRIDKIKSEPEIEYTNGKGFVPEWQSHWVVDSETERDLEEMAKSFKMQLDLQEGILNLKGHAGTGKDVRIKMFSNRTNRPYFGIDCTKWTTEFELSEDVMLESKEGASQTIKVPSAVLNGITTPGALVYFNEFTAMPEQAQIFLHALMDEKRSLTLKTSSGKVIRALPSVLLASSMNPGYPGTFEPQFATRSRMVSKEIGYPPLTRKTEAGDKNPNPPYDASEALRIARGVDSLADLTYEASLERNEFVKMWEKYVNGIENGAGDPTGTQKFDIETILALTQFSNILRDNFIKIFEKSREARNALPVTQPITGRELRRCAYSLSKMTAEEKATANPEAVARDLLKKHFLTHIDKTEDYNKIWTAMNTWTSKKRVMV